MKTWNVELSGTITRDIRWVDVDAETEQEAREICQREKPTYRVRSIIPAEASDRSSTASTSPTTNTDNSSST